LRDRGQALLDERREDGGAALTSGGGPPDGQGHPGPHEDDRSQSQETPRQNAGILHAGSADQKGIERPPVPWTHSVRTATGSSRCWTCSRSSCSTAFRGRLSARPQVTVCSEKRK